MANYFQAFRFATSNRNISIAQQLAGLPDPIALPRWKQIEAIAVDANGHVWLTSEGSPAPLGQLVTGEAN